MKKLLFCVLVFSSLSALAVPRSMHLVSPKRVWKSGENVKLAVVLECTNDDADEWGQVVAVSDDEGDMALGVGLVISAEECKPGPAKEIVFSYPLKSIGLDKKSAKGVTLEPISLKK